MHKDCFLGILTSLLPLHPWFTIGKVYESWSDRLVVWSESSELFQSAFIENRIWQHPNIWHFKFVFRFILFCMYDYFVCMHVCTPCACLVTLEARRGHWVSGTGVWLIVSCQMGIKTKSRSSGRTSRPLNHWATLAPIGFLKSLAISSGSYKEMAPQEQSL